MFPNGNILPERPLRTAKCTRPGTFAPQIGGAVAPCEADVLRLNACVYAASVRTNSKNSADYYPRGRKSSSNKKASRSPGEAFSRFRSAARDWRTAMRASDFFARNNGS